FADYAVPLAVPRADPGEVEVVGWNVPDAARRLRVTAAAAGDDFATVFHPGLANPLRVRLEPHACFRGPADRPLAPPFSATGRLEKRGATDHYPVVVKKGQAIAVQVRSSSLDLPVAPVARVLGADGVQLARGEPGRVGGETAVSFAPAADGTVTVEVRDLYAAGGPRSAYLLRVTPPEPDYDLTVSADRFAVPPGKSIGIPVKVTRKNGFAKPVEVVAEGLPEGVRFEVKPPAGKADPNTITLTLAAEKPASGAFRLVGRVKDEPAFTRTARTPLPEFDETTADLWVSVTDKPVGQPPKKKKN